ncbi:nicotinate-nucleotide adenylyltransferase [Hydrogenophilus islandicus]
MIGLIGGTFDPIHYAHLRLAEEAREMLRLDAVWFVPNARPPHRAAPAGDAAHRAAMVALALADAPTFRLERVELDHPEEPSYTVTTLMRLRHRLGDATPLFWLVGADAFVGLDRWHRWTELLTLAHLVVATRPGVLLEEETLTPALQPLWASRRTAESVAAERTVPPAGWVIHLDATPLAISATQIRALIAAGKSARYLLPDAVLRYIEAHHLYRNDHGADGPSDASTAE